MAVVCIDPLLKEDTVSTEVVIGPNAKKPLTLKIPLFVSDMSFGALAETAKELLARCGCEPALICTWRFDPEQLPDFGDIGRTVAVSEEAVVADAMLTSWEHMDQEPADELGRCQRHGGVATGAFDAAILDAEGVPTNGRSVRVQEFVSKRQQGSLYLNPRAER